MEGERLEEIRKDLVAVRLALRHCRGALRGMQLHLEHHEYLVLRALELADRALVDVKAAEARREVRDAS